MEPELASNNSLKIRSGMLAHHGNISSVKIGTYDEVGLSNGSQGMKRIDLVVCRYTKNAETEVESCDWVVIMGTPAASNPVAPAYTVGNLQDGDLVDDCPIFEVHYDGINVTEVKKLVSVVSNLTELNSKIESAPLLKRQHFFQSVTVSAGGVATVTMGKYSIPDGYELWGILPDLGRFGDQFLLSITRYNDAIVAKVRNFHTSALTSRISCSVVYVRNS